MQSISHTAAGALKAMLDQQPLSEAKVVFAWRLAAGPTLAAAATVAWSTEGRLCVKARTDEWRRELLRARPLILHRIRELVGADAVKTLTVEGPA